MIREDLQPFGNRVGGNAVVDQFSQGMSFYHRPREHGTYREQVGFAFDPRFVAKAVEIGGHAGRRHMKEQMAKLVKLHHSFGDAREAAVDHDIVAAFDAIVKSANSQRHFLDRDVQPAANALKILIGERAFVPAKFESFYFVE